MAPDAAFIAPPEAQAGFDLLVSQIRPSRPDADLDRIEKAFRLSAWAHRDQSRRSGEPYIVHPLEVAAIVASLHMDDDAIIAAILHDAVEDTSLTGEDIEQEFGRPVRELVEGVTKLRLNSNAGDGTARQRKEAEITRAAESLRKLLLAMAKDVRVMVIKLADRLHNMRTLDAMPPERRTRIANETLEVYAPLAARLGIWQVKWQLEDLSFKTLHPDEYRQISELVNKTHGQRQGELEQAIALLKRRLSERGLPDVVIMGRSKHLYSIYNKMVKQKVAFDDIYDLLALRIIVKEVHECYLALGVVHDAWLPIPGLFTDHVGMPKPNGYQSIHTKVVGPSGDPLEIQIRTARMHEIAEYGVAAHWSYKEGKDKNDAPSQVVDLRRQLFDWSSDARTSSEFLKAVSTDLFSEQVFVFTPKGDVLDLPKDSTPIDFAFRVHTELGLRVVGAKINGVMQPIGSKLQNGDVVELITRSSAQPSLDWLKFVRSAHAKSKIKSHLRKSSRAENAQRGREAIERELRSQGLDPRLWLGEEKLGELAGKLRHVMKAEDVFTRVGEGLTSVQSVVEKIKAMAAPAKEPAQATVKTVPPGTSVVGSLDNVMIKRAKCCQPIPGDDVSGYVTRGRGIVIHRKVCPNFLKLVAEEGERVTPVGWEGDEKSTFPISIKIVSLDRDGLLNDVTTIFAEGKAGVVSARIRTISSSHTAEIDFTINVRDFRHFLALQNKIGQLGDVLSVLRVYGKGSA